MTRSPYEADSELGVLRSFKNSELPTICVDFNGVMHDHRNAPKGIVLPDSPAIPGAIEWAIKASEHYRLVFLSARFGAPGVDGFEARKAAALWLIAKGIDRSQITHQPDFRGRYVIASVRPPCHITIDDRAWRFDGRFPTVEEIAEFRPWNRP